MPLPGRYGPPPVPPPDPGPIPAPLPSPSPRSGAGAYAALPCPCRGSSRRRCCRPEARRDRVRPRGVATGATIGGAGSGFFPEEAALPASLRASVPAAARRGGSVLRARTTRGVTTGLRIRLAPAKLGARRRRGLFETAATAAAAGPGVTRNTRLAGSIALRCGTTGRGTEQEREAPSDQHVAAAERRTARPVRAVRQRPAETVRNGSGGSSVMPRPQACGRPRPRRLRRRTRRRSSARGPTPSSARTSPIVDAGRARDLRALKTSSRGTLPS